MRRYVGQDWFLAVLSGLLQVLVFPSISFVALGWIAITPLILAILRPNSIADPVAGDDKVSALTSPVEGFWLGYLCGVIWYGGTCYWVFHVMHAYGGLPTAVAAGILVLFCLYLALYHGLFGWLLARVARAEGRSEGLRYRRALFAVPFLWVAVELARSRITGFPWDVLGTSQVDNLPLAMAARVTGVYGVSFEIALVNTAFAAAFLAHPRARRRLLTVAVLAALLFQAGALWKPKAAPTTHTALLVQHNLPIVESGWTVEEFDRTLAELRRSSDFVDTEAHPAPRIIIWPESPAPFYLPDPRFRDTLADIAQKQDAFVIAGSLGVDRPNGQGETPLYNSAALIAPSGELTSRYDKVHLVPFGEYVPFKSLFFFAKNLTREVGTFTAGAGRNTFALDGHRIGTFICYESVFPDEVRQFPLNGAEVLVNISNDGWFGHSGAPGQHLNMARMRAIENNRWLLRATNTGITATIDPYGRVVSSAPRNQRVGFEAPYAFIPATTFYTRHGDWFAYLCAIISVVVLLLHLRTRATAPVQAQS